MAYSTQAIKYGWTALAGIVLTGATIYIASNTRRHVTQRDVIPIPLGVAERCISTQYGTNALGEPLYRVSPPEFVRTWTSNVYTSTNVTTYTNIVTNTIGFYVDKAMLVSLDPIIKQLVTNFYDVTTMLPMTVTGLWASLGIGDGTNQFTSTSAIGTNPATYGDYPQQIYVTDLQERYKVLYSLSYINNPLEYTISNSFSRGEQFNWFYGAVPWEDAKGYVETNLSEGGSMGAGLQYLSQYPGTYTKGLMCYADYPIEDFSYSAAKAIWKSSTITFSISSLITNVTVDWLVSLTSNNYFSTYWSRHNVSDWAAPYDANGSPNINPNEYYKWGTKAISSTGQYFIGKDISSDATWCEKPTDLTGHASYYGPAYVAIRGFILSDQKLMYRYGPAFEYCTNKYW